MPPSPHPSPLRLFLDVGVLVDGFFNPWGTCKGVLILATLRAQFRAIVAEPISEELVRAVQRKTASLSDAEVTTIKNGIAGWWAIARPLSVPWPSEAEMLAHAGLLSAIRHRNDMAPVIAAALARPDWVLSTNSAHWNDTLAARTSLRIATPKDFLASLHT